MLVMMNTERTDIPIRFVRYAEFTTVRGPFPPPFDKAI